jgi:nucleoside-diphosphate-sugar epimerase
MQIIQASSQTPSRWFKPYLQSDALIRIAADLLMVAGAYVFAYMIRLLGLYIGGEADRVMITELSKVYSVGLLALMPISLVVFATSGFYTHGRAYQGRYKALVIAQAVSLTYLIFGFLVFLLPGAITQARLAVFMAWGLSLFVLVGSRMWAFLFKRSVNIEATSRHSDPDKIKNVLVIGGAGYIGSALMPKLLEKGYSVRLLDLLMYGTEPIKDVLSNPRLEVVQADFRQVDQIVEAMRGMDAVIHLGGLVGDPACAFDENLTIEVNLMATKMIAEVAKGSGISRFIFASTCSVYGASDEMLNERSKLNPVSLYARSKIAGERVLFDMIDRHFSVTVLRFGTIFGFSGRTRFDLVVNLLTAKAHIDQKITVFGGDQWRPFVHVDDAALAVLKSLEAPSNLVRNEIFNVGSSTQNFTLGQVGEIIKRFVPNAELIDSGQDGDRRNYRVDFSKIRDTLGFRTKWTLEAGVKQMLDAFAAGKIENYQSAKYSNVKFLNETTDSSTIKQYYSGWEREYIDDALNSVN